MLTNFSKFSSSVGFPTDWVYPAPSIPFIAVWDYFLYHLVGCVDVCVYLFPAVADK